MEIFYGLENVTCQNDALVTVGAFDGLHLGHQRILKKMSSDGDRITIVTFDPHPQTVIRPNISPPPLITTFEERIGLFKKHGVNRLVVINFTQEFAQITAEKFVEDILVKTIGMERIYVGPNHGFGRGRKGNVQLLKELGEKFNYQVEVLEAVNRFNIVISSSQIRKMLLAGDMLTAWRCLSRPLYLHGKVIPGDGRGRKLGFPTANLELLEPGKLMPPPGVYATVVEVDNYRYPSVSHFGERPTFPGAAPSIETHIIGFDGNIYDHTLQLGMIDRLRDIGAFPNPQMLVKQMLMDRAYSKRRLAELGFSNDARMRMQRYGKIIGH